MVVPGSASYSPAMTEDGGISAKQRGRNFAYNPPKEAEQSVKGRGLRMRRRGTASAPEPVREYL